MSKMKFISEKNFHDDELLLFFSVIQIAKKYLGSEWRKSRNLYDT